MSLTNNVVKKFLGVNYKFNGENINTGLDCINLCILVGKEFNKEIPNINHINFTQQNYSSLFNLRNDTLLWENVEPQQHTLAVFTINGIVKHVGYMLNETEFIHIMENSRVTVDSITSIQWKRRFIGCYKYIGN